MVKNISSPNKYWCRYVILNRGCGLPTRRHLATCGEILIVTTEEGDGTGVYHQKTRDAATHSTVHRPARLHPYKR